MTANPERGEVDLVVGGKNYILALTTNTICALEKRTSKPYGELIFSLQRMHHENLRELLWSALQRHHAKQFPKIEAVGDLMDEAGGFRESVEAFTELGKANARKAEAAKDGESANPPEASSTGDSSPLTLVASA